MVAHAGKIYRLGGLQAFNEDADSPDLHSSDKAAVFDPTTSQWTSLTNLPDARSSHDAVVLGDQVFVVGGWNLTGDEEGTWHEYGLTADLSQRPLVWQKFEVPFQRRALAVSTLGQKSS